MWVNSSFTALEMWLLAVQKVLLFRVFYSKFKKIKVKNFLTLCIIEGDLEGEIVPRNWLFKSIATGRSRKHSSDLGQFLTKCENGDAQGDNFRGQIVLRENKTKFWWNHPLCPSLNESIRLFDEVRQHELWDDHSSVLYFLWNAPRTLLGVCIRWSDNQITVSSLGQLTPTKLWGTWIKLWTAAELKKCFCKLFRRPSARA